MSIEERRAQLRVETEGNVTVLSGPPACGKSYTANQRLRGKFHRRISASWLCHEDKADTIDSQQFARLLVDVDYLLVEECFLNQIKELKKLAKCYPGKTFFFTERA